MVVSSIKPDIYAILNRRFGVEWDRGVIITYAPLVHCKDNLDKFPEKIIHESVHLEQQGKNPQAWWDRYLVDPYFRLEQEVDAYGAEVRWILKNVKDRNRRYRMINQCASDLSSNMYGYII